MNAPEPGRVVTLIASATEIVCVLGCEPRLVGRSHECDFPESVKKLPVLTAPRFDVSGSSKEIDARVKDVLRDALSVYRVDADALAALAPSVIVTQSQCEVCAVSLADVERALGERWRGPEPTIVSLAPNALGDVLGDFARVARALGVPDRGEELIRKSRARIDAIAAKARALPRRRVACIEWIEPLMAAGNWVPELVALAGGENLFGEAGKHSPWMSFDELVAKDPDAIAVLPCGFDIAKTREEMRFLVEKRDWQKIKAVARGDVFLCDGNQFFNRPGPRLVESLEILVELLHPDAFRFGHEGRGFARFCL